MKAGFYVFCPETGCTNFEYPTQESAEREAECLARKYPESRFRVLAVIGECRKMDIIWDKVYPDPR